MTVLGVAALALALLSILLLCVVAGRRVQVAYRQRRRARIQERLKPVVLGFLDTGAGLPAGLTRPEQELLADLLGSYARMLRGAAHERIAGYFRQQGVTVRELRELRESRRGWRRATAAHRLGDIGPAAAAGDLVAALADADRDVRTAAARSLGRLGQPEAAGPLLAALAGGRIPELLGRWALLQIGPPAVPRLRDLTASPQYRQRAGALQLLGLLGGAGDADLIEPRLRDGSALVRQEAAAALGRVGSSRCVPGLLGALEDRIPAVRAAAATALGRLRDQRAAGGLLTHALADQFDVARAAAHALAAADPATARWEAGANPQLREAADLARLG